MIRARWVAGALVPAAVGVALLAGCTTVRSSGDYSATTGSESSAQAASAQPKEAAQAPKTGAKTGARTDSSSDLGTRVACTSEGDTIVVPKGWKVQKVTVASGLRTFKALGPNGCYLRIDEELKPEKTDMMANARDLDRRLAKKYADYRRIDLRATTFVGRDAVRWEFEHTDDSGNLIRKLDLFVAPDESSSLAILVAVDAQNVPLLDVVDTFELAGQ